MSSLIENNTCCGLQEIEGVSDMPPEDVFIGDEQDPWHDGIAGEVDSRNIVFTDITRHKRDKSSGWAFAKFIQQHGLGTVIGPSPAGKNPNTCNLVVVWVWTPNVRAVQKLQAKLEREREAEDNK